MKRLLMALSLMFAGYADAASLNVIVAGTENEIQIKYRTLQTFSSMCFFKNHRVEVKLDHPFFPMNGRLRNGEIHVQSHISPASPCLAAFGPHSGGISFARGTGLPSLSDGEYGLTINEESYGKVSVNGKEIKLVQE